MWNCKTGWNPPLIHVNRWQSGELRKATCTSGNFGYGPARWGEGLCCVTALKGEKAGQKQDR